jgi:tight adherence protein B
VVDVNRVLAGLCGAGIAVCLLGVVRGLRWPVGERKQLRLPALVDPRELVARWPKLLVAFGTGVVAGVATGWPVMVPLAAAAAWWLPPMLGPDRESERFIMRTEALAGFTEMLRDTLAAASGLEQALRAAASKPPAAIAEPLEAFASDLRHGVRLVPALCALRVRLDDELGDRICATLVHASRRPAMNLPAVLSMLAAGARSQALAMRQTVAARSQVRTAVRVIAGVVLIILGVLLITDAAYLAPFATPLGQLDLLFAGTLFAAAFAWLKRMARPEAPLRLLTNPEALDAEGDYR